jgi:hypothetical protein
VGKTLQVALVAATLVITSAPVGATTNVETRAGKPPSLRRTTVVTAERSATVDVRLTRDLAPFLGDGKLGIEFVAHGAGRILAWALVGDQMPVEDAPIVYGWTIGRCAAPGCEWGRFVSQYMFEDNLVTRGDKRVLPSGAYTMYVVTDGAPGSVSFRMAGLKKGKVTLGAKHPATVDLPVMEPMEQATPTENVQWSGSSTEVEGPGLAIVNTWVDRGDAKASGAAGLCIYEQTEPPPDETAYVPGCPAAFNPVEPAAARHVDVGYRATGTLPTAGGGWYSHPEEVSGGTVALWLQF